LSKTKYTYAVARIRALEVSLLTNAVIEQLLACKSAEQALQFLVEKGWGDLTAGTLDADEVLNKEEEKMWQTIREVAPDMHVFDVLSLPKLYHNLKAAIKEVCTEVENKNIFYDDCEIPGEEMFALVQNKEFDKLPGNMSATAREAFDTLLHTRDGQLCDLIIDHATLEAMLEAGKKSGEKIIEEYAQTAVAIADIKIAVRSQKTGKNAEFMKKAMVNCSEINVDQLTQAALAGAEEIAQYLEGTSYREGADALRISPSAFERWCDNKMTDSMRSQKYESFSVGPLLAYLLARQNEIKTVRIILTGKQNEFPDEAIRERIREMYV
jgi:vacuolar-type H+-ATPase subunit C/Vma6